MTARWQTFELQLLVKNNDAYNSTNLPVYTRQNLMREPFDRDMREPFHRTLRENSLTEI
jgi:hypothetical protein